MIEQKTLDAAREHAAAEYPRESVGLVVRTDDGEQYIAGRNISPNPERDFALHAEDYADAQDMGEIVCTVHSHPNGVPIPSHVDLLQCEASGHPGLIITLGGDPLHFGDTCTYEPCGWFPPLKGREYFYGIFDCYALVRDWYQRERGVELPQFDHGPDLWWAKRLPDGTDNPSYRPGWSPFEKHFSHAGFEPVKDALREGDVIVMQIKSDVPNHAAVYLDDGTILHHMHGRLSGVDVYGGYWAEVTRLAYRLKGAA